jgi:hypothetical protein
MRTLIRVRLAAHPGLIPPLILYPKAWRFRHGCAGSFVLPESRGGVEGF